MANRAMSGSEYWDDSDEASEARWAMKEEEPGKYQPQYNEEGELMWEYEN